MLYMCHVFPLLKQLPDPRISKKSPHKGELRLISGRYTSRTKIAEEETGSNPNCSVATAGDPQASRPVMDLSIPTAEGPDC